MAIVATRKCAVSTVRQNLFVKTKDGDPLLGLLRKRTSAVKGALTALEGELTFSPRSREVLMSLDRREALVKDAAKLFMDLCCARSWGMS